MRKSMCGFEDEMHVHLVGVRHLELSFFGHFLSLLTFSTVKY